MLTLIIASSLYILSVSGNGCCDCTESKYTPNCNLDCDATICSYDPFCCNYSWDWICAAAAADECSGPTPPSGSIACCQCTESSNSPNCNDECDANICSYDAYCCNVAWDWICADAANVECEAAEGDIDEGEETSIECADEACCDCTESESGPNCSANPACDPIICELDSYCCQYLWDDTCADGALNICNSADYWSGEDGTYEIVPGPCCDCTFESNSPGCNEGCENEICGLDSHCCEFTWDHFCAEGAMNICLGYDYDYDYNDGNYYPYIGAGDEQELVPSPCCDCLDETYNPGCNEGCDTQVCGFDDHCCQVTWDNFCADAAHWICAGYDISGDYAPTPTQPYNSGPDQDENEADCSGDACGQLMYICGSSPDCYDGMLALESECEQDNYQSLEQCVEQLLQESSNQQIIGFCNNNESAAGDLQSLAQCFLGLVQSAECNIDEQNKSQLKTFMKAFKKIKAKRSRASRKQRVSKRARDSKRPRSDKVQREKQRTSQRARGQRQRLRKIRN